MPYKIRKLRNKNLYKVYNVSTGKIFSKSTSLERAQKQLRLLLALEYNPNFRPRKSKSRGRL
jgi:hypothetical protein